MSRGDHAKERHESRQNGGERRKNRISRPKLMADFLRDKRLQQIHRKASRIINLVARDGSSFCFHMSGVPAAGEASIQTRRQANGKNGW